MDKQSVVPVVNEMLAECRILREKHRFDEAIAWVEKNVERLPNECRARAWFEAFYAATAKGDTESAKRFMLAIDQADPQALRGAQV